MGKGEFKRAAPGAVFFIFMVSEHQCQKFIPLYGQDGLILVFRQKQTFCILGHADKKPLLESDIQMVCAKPYL